MNYEKFTRLVKDLIKTNWNNATPMIWPNEAEDLGDVDYFARIAILPASGRQVAVGGNMHRRRGAIIIQLFAKQGLGLSGLSALEEKAVKIFTDNVIPKVQLMEAGADRIGHDGHGYYQSNVSCAFQFDVT